MAYFLAIAPIWRDYLNGKISMQTRDRLLTWHRANINTTSTVRSSNADLA